MSTLVPDEDNIIMGQASQSALDELEILADADRCTGREKRQGRCKAVRVVSGPCASTGVANRVSVSPVIAADSGKLLALKVVGCKADSL